MPYCHKEVHMMKMNGKFLAIALFSCLCFVGAMTVSVNEGDSVPLNTGVIKQKHDTMLWYFNDTLVAHINIDLNTSCVYDGEDGRFRGRVVVDYKTGSLIITDIRSEHAGRYEAELIRNKSSGTSTSLNRTGKCDRTKIIRKNGKMGDTVKLATVTVNAAGPGKGDSQMDKNSGLSSGTVPGIVVTVLLVCVGGPAAALIYYCHKKKNRLDGERRGSVENLRVSLQKLPP